MKACQETKDPLAHGRHRDTDGNGKCCGVPTFIKEYYYDPDLDLSTLFMPKGSYLLKYPREVFVCDSKAFLRLARRCFPSSITMVTILPQHSPIRATGVDESLRAPPLRLTHSLRTFTILI